MDKLYTINEAAEALRISRAKVYVLIKEGAIKPIKIGGRTLFTDRELTNFVRKLEKKGD